MRGFYPSLIIIRNFFENVTESSLLTKITKKQIKSFHTNCSTTEILTMSCSLVNDHNSLWNIMDQTDLALESSDANCTRIIINNIELHGLDTDAHYYSVERLNVFIGIKYRKHAKNILTYTFDSSCFEDSGHMYRHFEDVLFCNDKPISSESIPKVQSLFGESLLRTISIGDLSVFADLQFLFPLCSHETCCFDYVFIMCRDVHGFGKMWSINSDGNNVKMSTSHFMMSYLLYSITRHVLPCCVCFENAIKNFAKAMNMYHMFSGFKRHDASIGSCECKSPVIREMILHAFSYARINEQHYRRYKDIMYLVHPYHRQFLKFSTSNLAMSSVNFKGYSGCSLNFIESVVITNTYDKPIPIILSQSRYVRPRKISKCLDNVHRIANDTFVVIHNVNTGNNHAFKPALYMLEPGSCMPNRIVGTNYLHKEPLLRSYEYTSSSENITDLANTLFRLILQADPSNIEARTNFCVQGDLAMALNHIGRQVALPRQFQIHRPRLMYPDDVYARNFDSDSSGNEDDYISLDDD